MFYMSRLINFVHMMNYLYVGVRRTETNSFLIIFERWIVNYANYICYVFFYCDVTFARINKISTTII